MMSVARSRYRGPDPDRLAHPAPYSVILDIRPGGCGDAAQIARVRRHRPEPLQGSSDVRRRDRGVTE